jgi:hypothetical protein
MFFRKPRSIHLPGWPCHLALQEADWKPIPTWKLISTRVLPKDGTGGAIARADGWGANRRWAGLAFAGIGRWRLSRPR